MTKQDYAQPMKSNGVSALGYLLRIAAKLAVAVIITILLGIELP